MQKRQAHINNPARDVERDIVITRVRNGWIVNLPRPIERYQPEALDLNQIVPGFKEILQEIVKIRDEDPLLSELKRKNEELESDRDPEPVEDPVIGQDLYVFVCKDFSEVVGLLIGRFGQ
jgi:hypothetical protein